MTQGQRIAAERCGWAFDLGRDEAQRAEEDARVRLDWWIQHEKHIADVSSMALVEEILARCAKAPAVRRAIMRRLENMRPAGDEPLPMLLDILQGNSLRDAMPGHLVTSRRSLPAPIWRRFNEPVTQEPNRCRALYLDQRCELPKHNGPHEWGSP